MMQVYCIGNGYVFINYQEYYRYCLKNGIKAAKEYWYQQFKQEKNVSY